MTKYVLFVIFLRKTKINIGMNGFKSIQQDYYPKFLKNHINVTAHKYFTVDI